MCDMTREHGVDYNNKAPKRRLRASTVIGLLALATTIFMIKDAYNNYQAGIILSPPNYYKTNQDETNQEYPGPIYYEDEPEVVIEDEPEEISEPEIVGTLADEHRFNLSNFNSGERIDGVTMQIPAMGDNWEVSIWQGHQDENGMVDLERDNNFLNEVDRETNNTGVVLSNKGRQLGGSQGNILAGHSNTVFSGLERALDGDSYRGQQINIFVDGLGVYTFTIKERPIIEEFNNNPFRLDENGNPTQMLYSSENIYDKIDQSNPGASFISVQVCMENPPGGSRRIILYIAQLTSFTDLEGNVHTVDLEWNQQNFRWAEAMG